MATLTSQWGGDRVPVTFFIDRPRLERLQELVREYGVMVGRDVSTALTLCRAIDLLTDHLDHLEGDPMAMLNERLALLNSRNPGE